jgi:hypothetical protein
MIPGAPHKEGTQREMPNRLKASFEINKHESIARSCFKCS